jgi:hypothetical protein
VKKASIVAALALVVGAAGTAAAYPQFQMSRDQTCTGCHLSPAGGGLLTENGLNVAQSLGTWETSPELFYKAFSLPTWLTLGGDVRNAGGYVQSPEKLLAIFPMQYEVNARAALPAGLSLYVTGGLREAEYGNEAATHVWSREHYLMWQQKPGEATGLFVRAGRFMPVFGLRLVEHPTYTRKWGGTPLYAETYGVAAEYIDPKFELHATGFIKDPLIDGPEHSNGGALLGELRLSEKLSVGAEGMFTKSDDDRKVRGGVLAKVYAPAETLVMLEAQYLYQDIPPRGAPNQIVANLAASKFLTTSIMADLGLNYFNENIRITSLDREAVDLNVHWFMDSHLEAILMLRYEALAFGSGGPSAGYALAQLHYRL